MTTKESDRYITTLMIAESLGVTQRSIQRISKRLDIGIKVPAGKRGRTYRIFNRKEAMLLMRIARRFRGRPPATKETKQ